MQLNVINCDNCGKCCQHIGFPPFMYHEILNLPTDLKLQILPLYDDRHKLEVLRIKCVWLGEDNRCINYQHRPKVCKDFEVGEDACLRFRGQI